MLGFYNYTVVPTYMGLLSSVFGIYFALTDRPLYAIFCLMVSGAFDAFDGKIARTKKRTSAEKRFGIQIDSLSDLICFGVLPAIIGYSVGMKHIAYVAVLAIYILAALIRLAYFNVMEEERQDETDEVRKSYEGLPVTSAAIIIPLVYCIRFFAPKYFYAIYAAALIIVASAFVSKLKIKKPGIVGILIMIAIGIIEMTILISESVNYGV